MERPAYTPELVDTQLELVAGMLATLTEGAFKRACAANLDEERDRSSLVCERMARGFRLTVLLRARMVRERRRDEREIAQFAAEPVTAAPVKTATPAAEPRIRHTEPEIYEADREGEDDSEALSLNVGRRLITRVLRDQAEVLDRDGVHRPALARVSSEWAQDDRRPGNAADPPAANRAQRRRDQRRDKPIAVPLTEPDRLRRGSG